MYAEDKDTQQQYVLVIPHFSAKGEEVSWESSTTTAAAVDGGCWRETRARRQHVVFFSFRKRKRCGKITMILL